jgi:hypothetical protein
MSPGAFKNRTTAGAYSKYPKDTTAKFNNPKSIQFHGKAGAL